MGQVWKFLGGLFRFPAPFLKVFPPLWLAIFALLITADLASKKIVTDQLNYHLSFEQARNRPVLHQPSPAEIDATRYVPLLGEDGDYIKFRLVFNDRFVFGLGPNAPVIGFLFTLFATLFLALYRWHNPLLGHSAAWLMVFSGALGNLIDKAFIKSLTTREWTLGLAPREGYVSGVVDFVECIWFGWDAVQGIPVLSALAWETWPTFNLADSLIVVGIILLILTMREVPADDSATQDDSTAGRSKSEG